MKFGRVAILIFVFVVVAVMLSTLVVWWLAVGVSIVMTAILGLLANRQKPEPPPSGGVYKLPPRK